MYWGELSLQLATELSVSMSCRSTTLEDSSLEASSSIRCLSGISGRCVLGTYLVKKWSIVCRPGFSRFDLTFSKDVLNNEL